MKEINETNDFKEGYYLLLLVILRPSSKTTKLRVVFHASAKTTNGSSVNDLLYKGEEIHDDHFFVLIRFRKHTYTFTSDIKQMFRMIEISPSQYKIQKISQKDSKLSSTKILESNASKILSA